MELKLVSTANGLYDFDVIDADGIHRVTVPEDVQYGDSFNIYCDNDAGDPCRKVGGVWMGKTGIGGYLVGDLDKSICNSVAFKKPAVS